MSRSRRPSEGVLPLSYSTAGRYDRCPRLYQFTRIERLPEPDSDPARLGRTAHGYMEHMAMGIVDFALEIPLSLASEWQDIKPRLDAILTDTQDLIGLEEVLDWEYTIPEGVVQCRAVIDRLHVSDSGRARMVDTKTGWMTKPDIGGDIQGLWNALAVLKHYPHTYEWEFEQPQPRRNRVGENAPRTVMQIEDVLAFEQAIIAEARRMIQDKEFAPNPDEHCRLCPYVHHCDAGMAWLKPVLSPAGIPELPALTNRMQAHQYAKGLAWLDAFRGKVSDALREWTLYDGHAFTDDLETQGYGHHDERQRYVADVRRFMAIVEAHGIDPVDAGLVKVDMKAAEKLIWGSRRPKRDPISGLASLVRTRIKTEFGFRKKLGGADSG